MAQPGHHDHHKRWAILALCQMTPPPTQNGKCEVESYNEDNYAVEGLLSTAETLLEQRNRDALSINYDEDFGYPSSIWLDDPELNDEDESWGVVQFIIID